MGKKEKLENLRNQKTHSKLEWENCYEKESGFYTTTQIYKFLANAKIIIKKKLF